MLFGEFQNLKVTKYATGLYEISGLLRTEAPYSSTFSPFKSLSPQESSLLREFAIKTDAVLVCGRKAWGRLHTIKLEPQLSKMWNGRFNRSQDDAFFQSRGSWNSFIHEEHVMSLPLGAFVLDAVQIFWVYLNIHFHNCSQYVYSTLKNLTNLLLACEGGNVGAQQFPSRAQEKNSSSKVLLSTVWTVLLCFA